jgi:3-hydroxyisobutyrate dehydrogenase-like beta-hydroxyacid dehydrogenase
MERERRMGAIHRVAIIGLGVIGRRMLINMPRQGRLAVVGGWDPSPAARAEAARDFPWLTIADSAEALIASADVDLVYVGAPRPRAISRGGAQGGVLRKAARRRSGRQPRAGCGG